MSENTIVTVVWGVIASQAIFGFTVYAFARLFVTGRPMFERKTDHEPGRIVGIGR